MSQVQKGLIRVANADSTVYHCWELYLASVTGTFLTGEAVRWPKSAVTGWGYVTSYDATSKLLRIYRSSGTDPVENTVIEKTDASKYGTIESIGPASPPDWDVALSGKTTKIFAVGGYPHYNVSSTINPDNFELTAPWAEPTILDSDYGIHVDVYSPTGLPILRWGDVDAPGLVDAAFAEINRRIQFRGALIRLSAKQTGISSSTWTTIDFDTTQYDVGSWVSGATLVVPSGVDKVRVWAGLESDRTPMTHDEYLIRTTKNAGTYNGMIQQGGHTWVLNGAGAPVEVNAGDIFRLQGWCDEGWGAEASGRSWFAIEAADMT